MDTENDRPQKALQDLLAWAWGHPAAAIVPYTVINIARINQLLKSKGYDLNTLAATFSWSLLQHVQRTAEDALGGSYEAGGSSTPQDKELLDEALETVEELRQQRDGLRASVRRLETEALHAQQAIARRVEVIVEVRSRLGALMGALQEGAPTDVERCVRSLAHWMDTEVPTKLSDKEETNAPTRSA